MALADDLVAAVAKHLRDDHQRAADPLRPVTDFEQTARAAIVATLRTLNNKGCHVIDVDIDEISTTKRTISVRMLADVVECPL